MYVCVRLCVWACVSLTAAALCAGGALHSRQESFTLYRMEAGVSLFTLLSELLRKLRDDASCTTQRVFQLQRC